MRRVLCGEKPSPGWVPRQKPAPACQPCERAILKMDVPAPNWLISANICGEEISYPHLALSKLPIDEKNILPLWFKLTKFWSSLLLAIVTRTDYQTQCVFREGRHWKRYWNSDNRWTVFYHTGNCRLRRSTNETLEPAWDVWRWEGNPSYPIPLIWKSVVINNKAKSLKLFSACTTQVIS